MSTEDRDQKSGEAAAEQSAGDKAKAEALAAAGKAADVAKAAEEKVADAAKAAEGKVADVAKAAKDKIAGAVKGSDEKPAAEDKPGVKPPWQRGDELAPDTGKPAEQPVAKAAPAKAAPAKAAPAKKQAPAKAAEPAKRKKPLITGTAAPKLDEPADKPAAGGKERFVESPTRDIGRSAVRARDLPDLDEIHAAPAVTAHGGGKLGQRSAPTHVGASGTGARALRAS
ncbi:MAG: hypothetical protein QM634_15515, partial [Gordonia sp. (in: high G+C Gram-positive bacteria)]